MPGDFVETGLRARMPGLNDGFDDGCGRRHAG
jgi:hypothetical protein